MKHNYLGLNNQLRGKKKNSWDKVYCFFEMKNIFLYADFSAE